MMRLARISLICKYIERAAFAGCLLSAGALISAMFNARDAHNPVAVVAEALYWPLTWTFNGFVLVGFVAAVLPDVAWRIGRRNRVHRGK